MSSHLSPPEPEFSQPVAVDKIPAAGLMKTLDADEAARKRLSVRFGLLELPRLHAELTLQSARGGQAIRVTGNLVADVVQRCSVTNEPVPDHIEHDLDVFYAFEAEEPETQSFVDPNEPELEPITNGIIDIGELVAQNLGVALNPYPRKAGVVFETVADEEVSASVSPLSKIAELTKKAKDNSKG